jgi:heavy metal sensor kinase
MIVSIRARLTAWYSALTVVALSLFSVGVLWLHARWGRAQFDDELGNLVHAISRVMHEELSESGDLKKAAFETRESMDVPDRATAVLEPGGAPLAAFWQGFNYAAQDGSAEPLNDVRFTATRNGAAEWRVARMRESTASGDYVIFAAGALGPFERRQRLLAQVLFVATPLIALITASLSWWVASQALRPVTLMAREAEAFTVRRADWRLDTPAVDDELGRLVRAFNRLLGRLEDASQTQRQFMADASHELRTPVSVIQTAAEVTLERPEREGWEYREALAIVNEQSARLSRVVEDMFVLARADAGGQRVTLRPLYLDDVVDECARAAAVVAGPRDVTLITTLAEDVSVSGDHSLLRQLISNLLDNAVRHTPPRGEVTVSLQRQLDTAIVSVSDTGPGVAPEDRDRIFERFVRLDPARSAESGAGLGLPIARWIAEQHHGTVTLEAASSGGCRFVVRLPATGVAYMNGA